MTSSSSSLRQTLTKRRRTTDTPRRVRVSGYYVLLIVVVTVYLVPVLWVISTSLRTNENLYSPTQWIPQPLTPEHYINLFEYLPDLGTYLFNTLRIAVLSTIGYLLSSSMAGYALARLRFPGRNLWLVLLLLTMMIPGQVTLIPIYVMFSRIGWINTPLPLIVPSFFGNAFATFFFRQFFKSIPKDLEDAARVDGATRWRIYWSVILPVSRPALVAMGIIRFVGAWNDYFYPSIFLPKQDQWVLTQGLLYLTGRYTSQWGEVLAGVILMSLPMIILYIFGQRFFVQGITFTGIKG